MQVWQQTVRQPPGLWSHFFTVENTEGQGRPHYPHPGLSEPPAGSGHGPQPAKPCWGRWPRWRAAEGRGLTRSRGGRMSSGADFSWYKALGKEDVWTSVVRKHWVNGTKGYNSSREFLQRQWISGWKDFCSWNEDLFSKGLRPVLQSRSAWTIPIAPSGFIIHQSTKSN